MFYKTHTNKHEIRGSGEVPKETPATGNGLQDLGSATGNGIWATATGNGNLEAALLKHEGRPREATGGHGHHGNQQAGF